MRPTIPISDWRIAVDLKATAFVQGQVGLPATDCVCEACSVWRSEFRNIFSEETLNKLERFGINPSKPSDLYIYNKTHDTESLRVVYHVVGAVINGPNSWVQGNDGLEKRYTQIEGRAGSLYLVVVDQGLTFDKSPALPDGCKSKVVQIDFRITRPVSC